MKKITTYINRVSGLFLALTFTMASAVLGQEIIPPDNLDDLQDMPFVFNMDTDVVDWDGYTFHDFEGASLARIPNPDQSGLNTTEYVLEYVKVDGGQPWAGFFYETAEPMELTEDSEFRLKVWSNRSDIQALLKLEMRSVPDVNTGDLFVDVTASGEWIELTWNFSELMGEDFSAIQGAPFDRVVLIMDLNGGSGDGSANYTWFMDDFTFDPGTLDEPFAIPYSNALRNQSNLDLAIEQGFDIQSEFGIQTTEGGYLHLELNDYVTTPVIDFTEYDALSFDVDLTTFGGNHDQTVEIQVSVDEGPFETVDTFVTNVSGGPTVENNYNTIVDLTGEYNVSNGRVRAFFSSRSDGSSTVRFRDLEINEAGIVDLVSPADGLTNVELTPTLAWEESTGSEEMTFDLMLATNEEFTDVVADISEIQETGYTIDQPLEHLTSYYWRVRSVHQGIAYEWSDTWSFTTIIEAPGITELLSPANEAVEVSVSPQLNWAEADRAESFQLYIALDAEFSNLVADISGITELSYSPETLANNTDYYWRVRAVNEGGEGEWSEVWTFFTEYALEQPVLANPADEASDLPTSLSLSWNPVTDAIDYQLQVALDAEFDSVIELTAANTESAEKGKQTSGWNISQDVEGLDFETIYHWRVRALNNDGTSDWSESHWFETRKAPVDGVVSLSSPADEEDHVPFPVEFSWENFEGADSYDLQISQQGNFATSVVSTGLEHTEATITEVFADTTTFYWRVRATVGGQMTEWSEVWEFTTELRVPEIPVWSPDDGEENVSTDPLLVWGESERAESYSLQLSVSQEFDELIVDASELQHTEYQVSGLEGTTQYYWRVQAHNAAGASGWSQVLTFTTEVATSISGTELPAELTLYQNYPNPFNPTTIITFGLPEASNIQLAVYDMLGRRVAMLENGMRTAGWHEVSFDASNLSSGIYIYRIQAGDFVQTRKMMLVK